MEHHHNILRGFLYNFGILKIFSSHISCSFCCSTYRYLFACGYLFKHSWSCSIYNLIVYNVNKYYYCDFAILLIIISWYCSYAFNHTSTNYSAVPLYITWSVFSKILLTDTIEWSFGVFWEFKIWFMFWCCHCIAIYNIMIALGFNGTGLYFAPKQIADATLVVLINTVLTCAACMTRAAVKGYLEANTISSEHSACGN